MDYVPLVVTTGIVCFLVYWMVKCCCTRRTSQGAIIATPVVITSEVHRVAPGTTATQVGTIIQGHPTGTSAYPIMSTAYPAQHPAPYNAQPPYMQHYPLQTSAAPPPTVPHPHQQPAPVQFPSLPASAQIPPPPAASAPAGAPAAPMFNPPSYDQVVSGAYPAQAPYNPDFKG
ncbi:uncharacterized protein LOC126563170 [Anopheles maculipalpis]|uniref:uncharacterized protein LOC126563170 n=1 Tax=Anopheles maculipalpis TaxID=1496333 RepID=UPI002159935F|nr:uncharacterized protein LOC126563170 [Anopheles maculipalpis]